MSNLVDWLIHWIAILGWVALLAWFLGHFCGPLPEDR